MYDMYHTIVLGIVSSFFSIYRYIGHLIYSIDIHGGGVPEGMYGMYTVVLDIVSSFFDISISEL